MKLKVLCVVLSVVVSGADLVDASVATDQTRLVEVSASDISSHEALLFLPGGRAVVEAWPGKRAGANAWRIDEAVTDALRQSFAAVGSNAWTPVVIGVAPGSDARRVARALVEGGGELSWTSLESHIPQLGFQVPSGKGSPFLSALEAHDGFIVFADVQGGAHLQNARSAWQCQSGETGVMSIFEKGIRGEDQIIGLMDTGIDPASCFFADDAAGPPAVNDDQGVAVDVSQRKVLAVDFWWDQDWPDPGVFSWDSHGHGTHTAGSAAGDHEQYTTYEANDGMAPAARLVIQDGGYQVDPCGDLPGLGCPMQPLEAMLEQAWQQGARIHSNSWGDEEDAWPLGRYTERTADVDRFVWQHPEMLVLAAAGNAGSVGFESVISPSTGKNVVSVGATWPADLEPVCRATFSSMGWAHDGRIKPDLLAPGTNVYSAGTDGRSDTVTCFEVSSSGTSMATPTAAGLAALVRQYFQEGWHVRGLRDEGLGLEPSAALLKATLIASAVDLRDEGCPTVGPIPSREQGWGMIRLDRALWFEGDAHRLTVVDEQEGFQQAGDGEQHVFRGLEAGPLKVVLTWTDPPSSSVADINLVNDLDLAVEHSSGVAFQGNVFANGESVTGGEADRLNNVEVVWLPEAAAGTWTVSVSAHALPVAGQGYALAIVRPMRSEGARDARGAGRAGP